MMKTRTFFLVFFLSSLSHQSVCADFTDAQKCMRRFLHECLDDFDAVSQDAFIQIAQGSGALRAVEKVRGRWKQLKVYLISAGMSSYQGTSEEDVFETEICASIDNDLLAVDTIKSSELRAETFLGAVAKVYMLLTIEHKKERLEKEFDNYRVFFTPPQDNYLPSIEKLQEAYDYYNDCLSKAKVHDVYIDQCKDLLHEYYGLQKKYPVFYIKEDTSVTDAVKSLFFYLWSWPDSDPVYRAHRSKAIRHELYKELVVYEKKRRLIFKGLSFYTTPYIKDAAFIKKIKNNLIIQPQEGGGFFSGFNLVKSEAIKELRALLFYLSNNPETQKEFESFLVESKGAWSKQDKKSFLQYKIFEFAKGSFVAKDSEPHLAAMLSSGATLLHTAYDFWSGDTDKVKNEGLEYNLWASLCNSLSEEDHEVLLSDLADYCEDRQRNSIHNYFFPQESNDIKLFTCQHISRDAVNDLIDTLLDHGDMRNDEYFEEVRETIKQRLVRAYKEVEEAKRDKLDKLGLFYKHLITIFPASSAWQKRLEQSYIRQHNTIVFGQFLTELKLPFDKVLEDREVEYEDTSWWSDLEQEYREVAREYKKARDSYISYTRRCNELWEEFLAMPPKFTKICKGRLIASSFGQQLHNDIRTFSKQFFAWLLAKVVLPVTIASEEYKCREALVRYNVILPRYKELYDRYKRNCQHYTIVSAAKKRLKEKILE